MGPSLRTNPLEHGLLQDDPRLEQALRMLGGGAGAEVAVGVGVAHGHLEGVVDLSLGLGQCLHAEEEEGSVDTEGPLSHENGLWVPEDAHFFSLRAESGEL